MDYSTQLSPIEDRTRANYAHNRYIPFAAWCVGLILYAISGTLYAERYLAEVVAVSDGDTITVLDSSKQQHRIRLSGIDAPERKQAFGNAARQRLADVIFRKTVIVEASKVDRYGRQIAKVIYDGEDVNLSMVRDGYAWHYKQYEREQSREDRELYAQAERYARENRLELWRDLSPTPPWDFRRRKP